MGYKPTWKDWVIGSLLTAIVLIFIFGLVGTIRPDGEDSKLVQCIEKKFINNEFVRGCRTYSCDYVSGSLALVFSKDYDETEEDFDFKNVVIDGVVIILTRSEKYRIQELFDGESERKQKNLRNKLDKECNPKLSFNYHTRTGSMLSYRLKDSYDDLVKLHKAYHKR